MILPVKKIDYKTYSFEKVDQQKNKFFQLKKIFFLFSSDKILLQNKKKKVGTIKEKSKTVDDLRSKLFFVFTNL